MLISVLLCPRATAAGRLPEQPTAGTEGPCVPCTLLGAAPSQPSADGASVDRLPADSPAYSSLLPRGRRGQRVSRQPRGKSGCRDKDKAPRSPGLCGPWEDLSEGRDATRDTVLVSVKRSGGVICRPPLSLRCALAKQPASSEPPKPGPAPEIEAPILSVLGPHAQTEPGAYPGLRGGLVGAQRLSLVLEDQEMT